jgi:hypothetical protein
VRPSYDPLQKGIPPKEFPVVGRFPGGAVKSCITVIGNDGELSAFVNIIVFHLPGSSAASRPMKPFMYKISRLLAR